MGGPCEYGNDTPISIKGGIFLDYLQVKKKLINQVEANVQRF
jgi:hypothetical protein